MSWVRAGRRKEVWIRREFWAPEEAEGVGAGGGRCERRLVAARRAADVSISDVVRMPRAPAIHPTVLIWKARLGVEATSLEAGAAAGGG